MRLNKTVIVAIAILGVISIGVPNGFCADGSKLGTISFAKIVENSIAGKAAKQKITEEGQRMMADLKKSDSEIKALQEQLEKDASVMSKEAREEKVWQLDRKKDDLKALKQKFDRQIQETQMRLINQIRKDVFEIIQAYGKKEGYQLVIEDVNVVYAPEALDITEQIIRLYNEKQPKAK